MVMLPIAGVGSAAIILPPEPEQLVEGHTVFTVIEVTTDETNDTEAFHAAVAVLVREVTQQADFFRIPGVLWFNDQFLTSPAKAANVEDLMRFPCTGAVLAVQAGSGDPRPNNATDVYVKSYHVTDPNDNVWDIDVWRADVGTPLERLVWTVAINNNQAGYDEPDDGVADCSTKTDAPCSGPIVAPLVHDDATPAYNDSGAAENRHMNVGKRVCHGQFPGARDPGTNGRGYPCGRGQATDPVDPNAPTGTPHPYDSAKCPTLRYNALLYFDLADLTASGAIKDHNPGSADRANDVSGCHPVYGYYDDPSSPPYWPCPGGDDMREGNSHDYNPGQQWPRQVSDGRNNHGGSADCNGNGVPDAPSGFYYTGDFNCHMTADLDLYYGVHASPLLRNYVVFDAEGSTAPYHCAVGMTLCNQEDVS